MKRFIQIMMVLCAFCCAGKAEDLMRSEYSYRRYTTDDGLPSMMIEEIMQDGNGFIWISTTSGISRYDGFEFKTFLKGKFTNIGKMDTDEKGNFRAYEHASRYVIDKKSDSLIQQKISSLDVIICTSSSCALPAGYGIYVNQHEKKKFLYLVNDTGMVKIMENKILTRDLDYNRMLYDKQTNRLFVSQNDSLFVLSDNDVFTAYPVKARTFCSRNNEIWVIAADGLYCFENNNLKCVHSENLGYAKKAAFDRTGTLFIAFNTNIYRFINNTFELLASYNSIKDFIFDSDNNLWIATYDGLYNLFHLDFKNYILPNQGDVALTVQNNTVENAVYTGTLNGCVYKIAKDGIKQIISPDKNSANFYYYGCQQKEITYLPYQYSVLKIKDDRTKWLKFPEHCEMHFVSALPDGNLLAGGRNRFFFLTQDGEIIRTLRNIHFKQNVYARPCVDSKNRLWLGGYSGVSIFDFAADSVIKTMFTDSIKYVKYMANDNKGDVWFASENRLYVSNQDTVDLKHTFEYPVKAIHFTGNTNKMIVITHSSIYIFDSDLKNSVVYNGKNGFTGKEPSSGSITEDTEGNVWLPTITGLFCFNPEKLMREQSPPNLHLLSVSSSTDNIHWQTENTELKLNYDYNNLRFSYIGLSFSSSQNVRYHYRLLGFQNQWSEPVKNREVTFNNLPPGNYTFEIYADAGTDESKSETRSYSFSIRPAFWQTVWFWTVCIVALMFVSAAVALHFQRKKNRALFERLSTERELNSLRISSIRLKTIPHFNANVLSAIEYYIMNHSQAEALRLLGVYSNFTFQTLRQVERASRTLSEELEYVKMYLELEKLRFIDRFDYRFEIDGNVDGNVQLPNMILHTYCENAVKHGFSTVGRGGMITVSAVVLREGVVTVSVEDNGTGREAARRNRNVPGSKQGLEILSRQIEIYNRFNVCQMVQKIDDLYDDAQQACGTRFTVEAPMEFSYELKI